MLVIALILSILVNVYVASRWWKDREKEEADSAYSYAISPVEGEYNVGVALRNIEDSLNDSGLARDSHPTMHVELDNLQQRVSDIRSDRSDESLRVVQSDINSWGRMNRSYWMGYVPFSAVLFCFLIVIVLGFSAWYFYDPAQRKRRRSSRTRIETSRN